MAIEKREDREQRANYNTIKKRSVLKNYISYKKSGSEENTMKENKVQFIAITAMAVALTYVFTAFVNVRLPIAANGGLIHLGNVPLFIMAILFGKKTGAIAGGVGMGLFDVCIAQKLYEVAKEK